MRPLRIELSGFTAFREPAALDLEEVDLFALSGPTGAGKSSVIDAMTFALYGSVPRLDKGAVAPLISQGLLEARVRFDFAIGGNRYTAVRVLRSRGAGATTKEARLEGPGGEVLAGDAKEVTAEVERLIGLSYEHFTKCVVLPQGEFARLLHDPPARRQDLLIQLLDLDIYQRMMARAKEIAATAVGRANLLVAQIADDLAHATPEGLREAEERADVLRKLADRVEGERQQLARLAEETAAARRRADELTGRVRLLTRLATPAGVPGLAETAANSERAVEEAIRRAGDADEQLTAAESSLEALPGRAKIEAAIGNHRRREELEARLETSRTEYRRLAAAAEEAARRLEEAARRTQEAEQTLEALTREHSAHDLAAALEPGAPCPVCLRPVDEPPDREPPAALGRARAAVSESRRLRETSEKALRGAEQARAAAEERGRTLAGEIAAVAAALEGTPAPKDCEETLARILAADEQVKAARAAARDARRARTAAEEARAKTVERLRDAWAAFGSARDQVGDLGPPPAGREDLAAEWARLEAWASTARERLEGEARQAAERAVEAAAERDRLLGSLIEACTETGITVEGDRVPEAVAVAVAQAGDHRDRIERDLERAGRLRDERESALEEASVAEALHRHLSATGFERWLLDEAVATLVEGASRVLRDLTGGTFSLAADRSGAFAVIDHRNADQQRPAKTLSGGETFLASLALALSLSEHIAGLGTREARLGAIFLDEGFGTLDPEALDTVAVAIENLAASGRAVGIITHVREIAERAPVRFEVLRTPGGSRIEHADGG